MVLWHFATNCAIWRGVTHSHTGLFRMTITAQFFRAVLMRQCTSILLICFGIVPMTLSPINHPKRCHTNGKCISCVCEFRKTFPPQRGILLKKVNRRNVSCFSFRSLANIRRLGWPQSTVEKGPQSNESYERENPWNRTISTVLWVHKKLPQSTVKLVLPSNESYESKTGCNRTLATVLWVPLNNFCNPSWWS